MLVIDLNGVTFNGNSFLSFQVHIIQHLVHHISFADGVGRLQKAVSQGGFAVVNMSDDAKITDVLHVR